MVVAVLLGTGGRCLRVYLKGWVLVSVVWLTCLRLRLIMCFALLCWVMTCLRVSRWLISLKIDLLGLTLMKMCVLGRSVSLLWQKWLCGCLSGCLLLLVLMMMRCRLGD